MASHPFTFERLGQIGEQLLVWSILSAITGAIAEPILTDLQHAEMEHTTPNLPPMAEAVSAFIRGHINLEEETGILKKLGLGDEFIRILNANALNFLPAEQMLALERLGKVRPESADETMPSTNQALRQAGIPEGWFDAFRDFNRLRPSPLDVLVAELGGQIPTGVDPVKLYTELGGDPDYHDLMFNSRGESPTPEEALTLLNRGIIPESDPDGTPPEGRHSYTQAFLEGPWRNKWLPYFLDLRWYYPPPRTITAMFREGVLSSAEAVTLLQDQGLKPDLAAKYVQAGHSQKAQKAKDLTESEVVALYQGGAITDADATTMLKALGYDAKEAGYLLELASLRQAISNINSAMGRARSLYVANKIAKTTVLSILTALGVPQTNITNIVGIWDLEKSIEVKVLTPSQIADAWKLTLITQDQAMAELEGQGYQPFDAWILLSLKAKQPLPNQPPVVATNAQNPLLPSVP